MESIDLFGEISIDEHYKRNYAILHKLYTEKKAIFIPGNVPSLKNSKEIFSIPSTKSSCCSVDYIKLGNRQYRCTRCDQFCQQAKRPIIVPSARVKEYIEQTKGNYLQAKVDFKRITKDWLLPYKLGLFYIRASEHEFDYDNAGQIIQDLFQSNQIIVSDSMKNLITYPLGYLVSPKYAGVIILPMKEFPLYKFQT